MTQPTQTQYPRRAVVRTVLAAAVALLPVLPAIVAELGIGGVGWVASGLVVIGAATRVLAIPAVDEWLTDHLGGLLSARPRQTEGETE